MVVFHGPMELGNRGVLHLYLNIPGRKKKQTRHFFLLFFIFLFTYITLWAFCEDSSSVSLPAKCICTRWVVCFVQVVPCILYRVCCVYCTRCAVCIVQGVLCVFYKLCSVYGTHWPGKSSVNKEDFDIKSNII